MKSIVCGYARWRGMDKDIEVLVKVCFECELSKKGPTKQNLATLAENEKNHGAESMSILKVALI